MLSLYNSCSPSPRRALRSRLLARCSGSPSDTAAWWTREAALFVLVYDACAPLESLYTTSSSSRGTCVVAFADETAAAALAATVGARTGRFGVPTPLPPLALLLLSQHAGASLEVVPRGVAFDVPDETVDEASAAARAAAASAVRAALLAPFQGIRGALVGGAAASPEEEGREGEGSTTEERRGAEAVKPASRIAAALRSLGRKKLEALLPPAEPEGGTGVNTT